MNKEYKCKKCGNIFTDQTLGSTGFIKTVLKKCPSCGTAEVSSTAISKRTLANKNIE